MADVREIFTVQLARAAGKSADRFLRARGLQPADRDDVVSAAMLWCWEHQRQYSLTTTLETWVMNAVRDAYKKHMRHELRHATDTIDELQRPDETYGEASAESSLGTLLGALTATDRGVISLKMRGVTYRELWKTYSYPKDVIDNAQRRVKQLRRLLPDAELRSLLRRDVTPAASNPDDVAQGQSGIDAAIEQLDFPPPSGSDCPPCWRCKWYEGLLPNGKRSTRMRIADLEVCEAVRVTEARKIEIAERVRKEP